MGDDPSLVKNAVGVLTDWQIEQISNAVFQKLEDYAYARHSNIVSVFRDFDKDQSGAMDNDELTHAMNTLLPGLQATIANSHISRDQRVCPSTDSSVLVATGAGGSDEEDG